ncbi:MAG TPA: hypothetical protein VMB34_19320 [Acetobacteraceae bacterium]|nr:hypothetical protein [Acetobacteraceae bacterium]
MPQPARRPWHSFRHSWFSGRRGERLVGYDNAQGKGDHGHRSDREVPRVFVSIEPSMTDSREGYRAGEGDNAVARELQIAIGDSFDAMAKRVIDAWRRAERAEPTEQNAERHVGFETFALFARVRTPRRPELLRHVHRQPAFSIRALALALGRHCRRVQEDAEALLDAGLLDKDATGLGADYDAVRLETRIAL